MIIYISEDVCVYTIVLHVCLYTSLVNTQWLSKWEFSLSAKKLKHILFVLKVCICVVLAYVKQIQRETLDLWTSQQNLAQKYTTISEKSRFLCSDILFNCIPILCTPQTITKSRYYSVHAHNELSQTRWTLHVAKRQLLILNIKHLFHSVNIFIYKKIAHYTSCADRYVSCKQRFLFEVVTATF